VIGPANPYYRKLCSTDQLTRYASGFDVRNHIPRRTATELPFALLTNLDAGNIYFGYSDVYILCQKYLP
jgi:hypothetical protein